MVRLPVISNGTAPSVPAWALTSFTTTAKATAPLTDTPVEALASACAPALASVTVLLSKLASMVKSFAPVKIAPSAIYASTTLAIILVAKDAPTPALPSAPSAMTFAPAFVVLSFLLSALISAIAAV
ncbi:MAG: hypothetical protein ACOX3R_02275 [Desulfitobacteriia bacterium]